MISKAKKDFDAKTVRSGPIDARFNVYEGSRVHGEHAKRSPKLGMPWRRGHRRVG